MDSSGFWFLVLNRCLSIITLLRGEHRSVNLERNTVGSYLDSAGFMTTSFSSFCSGAYTNDRSFSIASDPARFKRIIAFSRAFFWLCAHSMKITYSCSNIRHRSAIFSSNMSISGLQMLSIVGLRESSLQIIVVMMKYTCVCLHQLWAEVTWRS